MPVEVDALGGVPADRPVGVARLFITEKAVSKHANSIFTRLALPQSEDDNRRVLAVLAYLNG